MKLSVLLLLTTALLLTGCNDSQSHNSNTAMPETEMPETETPETETNTISTPDSATDAASPDREMPTLAEASGAPPSSLEQYQNSLSRRCEADSDCVVKNVGSCCGYTPQCVHKDVQTFPEQVKALCEKEGRSSICGFQEPAGCACVENQCREAASSAM